MSNEADILIVGGGLSGSVLALALAQAGLSATIIDALPQEVQAAEGFDGRSYAMALTTCRLLRNLGLWEVLGPTAQPIHEIKVSDGRAGEGPSPLSLQFHYAEIEEGPMGHMIEDRHLRRALMDRIDQSSHVTRLSGQRVVDMVPESGKTALKLSDGSGISGKLVIAADGRGSTIAKQAGIKRISWGYGQTALVCAISHELPHNGIAHQFFMPSGPLAILPLTENRSSIVWSETAENAAAFQALDDQEYLAMLRPRFGSFLGDIQLAGQRYSYPLSLSLAKKMVAPRLALVGDAAHGVHPIAGQGLNAGLRDIAALVEVLNCARKRGEDIGSAPVLSRYEEWRRFDNAALALATDSFNRLFSNDNPLLRIGRDIGLGLVSQLPGLRRSFIREAAGLTGDIPPLMAN